MVPSQKVLYLDNWSFPEGLFCCTVYYYSWSFTYKKSLRVSFFFCSSYVGVKSDKNLMKLYTLWCTFTSKILNITDFWHTQVNTIFSQLRPGHGVNWWCGCLHKVKVYCDHWLPRVRRVPLSRWLGFLNECTVWYLKLSGKQTWLCST